MGEFFQWRVAMAGNFFCAIVYKLVTIIIVVI